MQLIGKMTLNRNPSNYFAETEQVAFHTGNLVPGIEATNDPLMQARLFSYLDTQLTRLGGPNFTQLPINRPHCPVNDMLRDGMHQTAVHDGISPYLPNGIDEAPRVATAREGAYVHTPRALEGDVVRGAPASFDDHYSQAALFYRSLTPIEQAHVVEAFTFELGKVYEEEIKKRTLAVLADVDANLCGQVAAGLGLRSPKGTPPGEVDVSPALSQITDVPGPIDGRKIGVIADEKSDLAGIKKLRRALSNLGAELLVIAPVGGTLGRRPRRYAGRPDVARLPLHRVRRHRRCRGGRSNQRRQAGCPAPRGLPPLQGSGRVGHRDRRIGRCRDRPSTARAS